MPLSEKSAAERARAMLTESAPASQAQMSIPKIISLIPVALEKFTREMAINPQYKNYFRANLTITLTNGAADLTPFLNGTSAKLLLGDIRQAQMYLTDANPPVQFSWVDSIQQLALQRRLGTAFPAAYLDGNTIKTRSTAGSLTGLAGVTVTLSAPAIPALSAIPIAIEGRFITQLAQAAAGQLIQTAEGDD